MMLVSRAKTDRCNDLNRSTKLQAYLRPNHTKSGARCPKVATQVLRRYIRLRKRCAIRTWLPVESTTRKTDSCKPCSRCAFQNRRRLQPVQFRKSSHIHKRSRQKSERLPRRSTAPMPSGSADSNKRDAEDGLHENGGRARAEGA